MATGTGIYVPTEQLGDGTADNTKFLRGDSKWASNQVEASPEAFLTLLAYAFNRIAFLEKALKIAYNEKDLNTPDELSLIQDKLTWM